VTEHTPQPIGLSFRLRSTAVNSAGSWIETDVPWVGAVQPLLEQKSPLVNIGKRKWARSKRDQLAAFQPRRDGLGVCRRRKA
jgi:hypothetical protein